MTTTTYETARLLAEHLLDAEVRPGVKEDVIINDPQFRETEGFWIFFYNTRTYLETGSIVHALAGNGPILVSKATGIARLGRSDVTWEEQIRG